MQSMTGMSYMHMKCQLILYDTLIMYTSTKTLWGMNVHVMVNVLNDLEVVVEVYTASNHCLLLQKEQNVKGGNFAYF